MYYIAIRLDKGRRLQINSAEIATSWDEALESCKYAGMTYFIWKSNNPINSEEIVDFITLFWPCAGFTVTAWDELNAIDPETWKDLLPNELTAGV